MEIYHSLEVQIKQSGRSEMSSCQLTHFFDCIQKVGEFSFFVLLFTLKLSSSQVKKFFLSEQRGCFNGKQQKSQSTATDDLPTRGPQNGRRRRVRD